MVDWKKRIITSGIAGIAVGLIFMLWKLIVPQITVTFSSFAVDLRAQGGFGQTFGDSILGLVGVGAPANILGTLLLFALSGAAVFTLGFVITQYLPLFGKNDYWKLVSVMVYGFLAAMIVLTGFNFGMLLNIGTLLFVAVNSIVIAFVLRWLTKMFGWVKVPE